MAYSHTRNIIVQQMHPLSCITSIFTLFPYKTKARTAAPTTPAKLPKFLIPSLVLDVVAAVAMVPVAVMLMVAVPLGSVVAVAIMLVELVPSPIANEELYTNGMVWLM